MAEKYSLGFQEVHHNNDIHNVLKDWEDLKTLIRSIDRDFKLFFGEKKVRRRGILARKKIPKVKRLITGVSKKINMSKQDYLSDYESK